MIRAALRGFVIGGAVGYVVFALTHYAWGASFGLSLWTGASVAVVALLGWELRE